MATVSGIELVKQGGETPEPSSKGTTRLEADINGRPRLVDEEGGVQHVGGPGEPVSLAEQVTPPTTTAGEVKLYAKRVGGVLKVYARDESNGDEVEVGAGAPEINWKDGTPGNPYINADDVVTEFNTIVMVQVEDPDSVTIVLPEITSASAGQRIGVRNLVNKKSATPGYIIIAPHEDDQVDNVDVGESAALGTEFLNFDLESDGVGRWTVVSIGWMTTEFVPPEPPVP